MKEKFITFPKDRNSLTKKNSGEKYTVSNTTPRIMVLIIVGVSRILYRTGSTREY